MHDKVLVAQTERETTTASGIVIEGAKGLGNTQQAKVLAVGPDAKEVKVGDNIYLDWSKAAVVKIDGAQRAMVKEEHIIAVVED